ncbi:hypothetical protein [Limnohabitans sp. T6-5]|nr:hypothetical protein [Limnohabitans sp. T6-5]
MTLLVGVLSFSFAEWHFNCGAGFQLGAEAADLQQDPVSRHFQV